MKHACIDTKYIKLGKNKRINLIVLRILTIYFEHSVKRLEAELYVQWEIFHTKLENNQIGHWSLITIKSKCHKNDVPWWHHTLNWRKMAYNDKSSSKTVYDNSVISHETWTLQLLKGSTNFDIFDNVSVILYTMLCVGKHSFTVVTKQCQLFRL